MKRLITIVLLYNCVLVNAQSKWKIEGRILHELDYLPVAGVEIFDKDSTQLGVSDENGYFNVEISENTSNLIFRSVLYYPVSITLKKSCSNVELFVIDDLWYPNKPRRKILRLINKRLDALPEQHLIAYE